MMSMADLIAIDIVTPKIYSGCSLEKEFTKLIRMNPLIVLCLVFDQIDCISLYVMIVYMVL